MICPRCRADTNSDSTCLAGCYNFTDLNAVRGRYAVKSSSGKGYYWVDLKRGTCECPRFVKGEVVCKHLVLVIRLALGI